jgi:hypothetical protein
VIGATQELGSKRTTDRVDDWDDQNMLGEELQGIYVKESEHPNLDA